MRVVFSRQALADLERVVDDYTGNAGSTIARSIGRRIEDVIDRIAKSPNSAPRVSQRSNVRTVAVIRYPFRIFYRLRQNQIEILHIRHTSRRPLSSP
ncbi:type II toxin-antitoxin system RelE/ParE family toxin [Rhodopseudomonas pseudopalustris]|uniref:type II toxin-antitoxin system RelE/ParE family toxin n=1 Tax=Rhodopseudomonas pseudopalustris TaxID=1513892 RepID=UPI000A45E218|nr:type II toxin-antitoxin system RelE/ParE family toxin [Rhodopseudomonas pseudopalustris]MBB1093033.1 type II toxin-antitoxin system RelE/ParE family toxin [Rhodopseudomonas palustris]